MFNRVELQYWEDHLVACSEGRGVGGAVHEKGQGIVDGGGGEGLLRSEKSAAGEADEVSAEIA
jgi:hypothetical protein